MTLRKSFKIGDLEVAPGAEAMGDLPLARLVTGNTISMPLRVVHGRDEGPTVWLSAAVHGDEIAGVEIIRRVLDQVTALTLAGTIIAVPIVNVHGFLNGDRYFPDRRDLNRSFPGSANGSLAGRVAHLFMNQIVDRCDVGIDLHTGSDHRINLPQIRADLDDPFTRELAVAFGAPLMLHAKLRDGSMRAAATSRGATVLLYEGGEAWRFNQKAVEAGTRGVLRVLERLSMTGDGEPRDEPDVPESRSSSWVRARRTGLVQLHAKLGEYVEKGSPLVTIHDSVGRRLGSTKAPTSGIVIGHTQQPLVNQGDAIVHIARLDSEPDTVAPHSKDFT